MERALFLMIKIMLQNQSISSLVFDRVYPAHVATINTPVFPLITISEDVSGDSYCGGVLSRTIVILQTWSSKNLGEAIYLRDLAVNAIDAAHPIYDDYSQLTLTPAGVPTNNSYPESTDTPRSYASSQRYLTAIALR